MDIPAVGFIWTSPPAGEGARKFYLPETEDGAAANRDLPWFYLVLLRGYQALYDLDGDPKYVDIFIRWMDWARRNARDAAGLFYNDWSGKKDERPHPNGCSTRLASPSISSVRL